MGRGEKTSICFPYAISFFQENLRQMTNNNEPMWNIHIIMNLCERYM